jgi:hypothetical protein
MESIGDGIDMCDIIGWCLWLNYMIAMMCNMVFSVH